MALPLVVALDALDIAASAELDTLAPFSAASMFRELLLGEGLGDGLGD